MAVRRFRELTLTLSMLVLPTRAAFAQEKLAAEVARPDTAAMVASALSAAAEAITRRATSALSTIFPQTSPAIAPWIRAPGQTTLAMGLVITTSSGLVVMLYCCVVQA